MLGNVPLLRLKSSIFTRRNRQAMSLASCAGLSLSGAFALGIGGSSLTARQLDPGAPNANSP